MLKREVVPGRIYKAEKDGSCVNCGRRHESLGKALEAAYIFEHYSLNSLLRRIREYLECACDEGGTVKITISVIEQQERRGD